MQQVVQTVKSGWVRWLTNADYELSVNIGVTEAKPAPLHRLPGVRFGLGPWAIHSDGSVQQVCTSQAASPLHCSLVLKLHMQPPPWLPYTNHNQASTTASMYLIGILILNSKRVSAVTDMMHAGRSCGMTGFYPRLKVEPQPGGVIVIMCCDIAFL